MLSTLSWTPASSAAADGSGAATVKAIQHHDVRAPLSGFDCRRDSGGAEADHDYVGNVVPRRVVRVVYQDRDRAAHLDCAS